VLCAALLGVPASDEVLPRVDIAARTARDLRAGECIGSGPGTLGWDHSLRAFMVPGTPLGPRNPVPFFMLGGVRLTRDAPADTVITLDMIEPPRESALWSLRRLQDELFFGRGSET
jgi:predicted homoserine dehydrogenase-like protein